MCYPVLSFFHETYCTHSLALSAAQERVLFAFYGWDFSSTLLWEIQHDTEPNGNNCCCCCFDSVFVVVLLLLTYTYTVTYRVACAWLMAIGPVFLQNTCVSWRRYSQHCGVISRRSTSSRKKLIEIIGWWCSMTESTFTPDESRPFDFGFSFENGWPPWILWLRKLYSF